MNAPECLERRVLFSGMTMITHGYNSNVDGWVATAAADVAARIGSNRSASIYTMSVARKGGTLRVTRFAPDDGQRDFRKTSNAELIVKLDWSGVSTGSYSTQAVANAVATYLKSPHGTEPALAGLTTHLIGHSRGASLMTALADDLGESGIAVDQQTNLDPHPVDGEDDILGFDFGDKSMATYDNVLFADTYWRTDGNTNNFDFDGEPVSGSLNNDLNGTVQKSFTGSAHSSVTAYYNGTIDTVSNDGGDYAVRPSWYAGTKAAPARTATGFYYSRLAGNPRAASGLSVLAGGRGKRTASGADGAQWTNAFGTNTRRVTNVTQGQTLQTRFYVQDKDGVARVAVYADTDANPYNGNTYLGGRRFSATELTTGKINASTSGLSPGSYFIGVQAGSGDTVRWDYTRYRVTVAAPAAARAATPSGVRTHATAPPASPAATATDDDLHALLTARV